MQGDPLEILARQRIISASAELEVQLSTRPGSRPAFELLLALRADAATALSELVTCNLFTRDGREAALTKQNKVKRYIETFATMSNLINEGKTLDADMRDDERQELIDSLQGRPEGNQELIELGLVDPPPD